MGERLSIVRRFGTPKNLLSILFAGVLLVLTAWSMADIDWNSVIGYLGETDLLWFLLALVVFHALSLVRSLRWRTLLRNAGYELTATGALGTVAELTRIIYLGWFVNCITVARLGDVYRCSLLRRSADVEFGVTAGTVLTERVVDFSVLVVVLGISTLFAFWGDFPTFVVNALLVGAALSGFGLTGVLALRHSNRTVERLIPTRFRRYYVHLRRGTVGSLDRIPTLVGYTAVGWIIEGVTMYLVAVAIGVSLPIAGAFVTALVAVLLSTVPVTPGGLGVTEVGIAFVLGWVGVDSTAVAAVTILNRLISYWSVVGVGVLLSLVGLRVPIELTTTPATSGAPTFGGESRT
ncbi:flippase-like domain-containing protein [Haladaptatus sp. AB618]|uniref:lysylphosphatidylglycerol synthase transmembrane domain-containing protein n=1 Tax=Haladaptatus sp. AB618 TaxID=2934173 RepID=UPI00209C2194|nr:lysylphosphatidylglycerol synthase transmembrane domain-containing protein [Haladaptatus sp. AB618]MCO8256240.1 flippase-like domain-containing protein [Haladaptatus sp. AB618]